MRDKLDDEKKEHLKEQDNKRKKEKRDNLDGSERKQLRKYEKEVKKIVRDNFMRRKRNI